VTDLTGSYLKYLEHLRLPDTLSGGEEDEGFVAAMQDRAENNPYETAWEHLDDLMTSQPDAAWQTLLGVLEQCHENDLSMIGAGALERLLLQNAAGFAGRFEQQIRSSDRFFRAFQYVRMTGVPLAIQQTLNRALLDRGADPKYVVEYDEDPEGGG
jgi:hypothetical protein